MSSTSAQRLSFWRILPPAIVLGLAFFRIWSASFDDFAVYWRAGKEALAGVSVYTEPGHYQFKYAPFTAWSLGWIHRALLSAVNLIEPTAEGFRPHGSPDGMLVSEGSLWVARFLYWTFLSGWTLWLVSLSKRFSSRGRHWKHLGLVLILLMQSLSEELNLGQINWIPILLMAMVLRELDRKGGSLAQAMLCSVALAIAVQFKLFSLIVYPLLAFRGRWTWIFGSVLVIAGSSIAVPGIIFGWSHALSEFQAWAITLTQSSDQLLYSGHNISWIGTVGKATGFPALAKASWAILMLAFVVLQYRIRNRSSDTQLGWNLAAILILNPLTWNYWMLFLAPLLFQLLEASTAWSERHPRRFNLIYLLLSPGFLMIFSPWSRNWIEPATILILVIAWFVLRKPHVDLKHPC